MTFIGTQIATALAAGAVAAGSLFGAGFDEPGRHAALVIDASLARDGRELVDPRLKDVDAEVRLPRTATEARTNVRYFDALGYKVYVAGSSATHAAKSTGVNATEVDGLERALDLTR